jgi:hypothetical protein
MAGADGIAREEEELRLIREKAREHWEELARRGEDVERLADEIRRRDVALRRETPPAEGMGSGDGEGDLPAGGHGHDEDVGGD